MIRQWNRFQNEGHASEMLAFDHALVSADSAPIPWNELRSVSMAAILAVRSIREGVPFDVP
jgi:hypothetical protein